MPFDTCVMLSGSFDKAYGVQYPDFVARLVRRRRSSRVEAQQPVLAAWKQVTGSARPSPWHPSKHSQVSPAACRDTASHYPSPIISRLAHPVSHVLKAGPFSFRLLPCCLLPLSRRMVHSLCGLFPFQGSQCCPPLQGTSLSHQGHTLFHVKMANCPVPSSLSIFVTWPRKPCYAHSVPHEHTSFHVCQ